MFSSIQRHTSDAAMRTMKVSKESVEELATRAHVVKMFRQFDVNGDGVIDRKELGEVLKSTDTSWNPDRLDRLFRVVDMNRDGTIDYEEFLIWIFATPKVTTRDLRAFRDAARRLSAGDAASARLSKKKQESEPVSPNVEASGLAISATHLPPTAMDNHCSEAVAQRPMHPETVEASNDTSVSSAPPIAPAKPINLRVMSMIGNEIGTVNGIDIATTTGHNLKSIIAATYGFPSFNMKLLLATGDMISNCLLSTQTCFCEAADNCGDDFLPVCCVLSTIQPLGPKDQGHRLRPFCSKAGMILDSRINPSDSSGCVSIVKVPELNFRDHAQRLVTLSFAPHLAPLIETGFNAAYRAELAVATAEQVADASEAFTYMDSEHNVSVDLSTCRLWTGMLQQTTLDADPFLADIWRSDCSHPDQSFGHVVSAVLWRLIFGWEGGSGVAGAGPVLEVLFLATHPAMREGGLAKKLVGDLEKGAMAMGCSAVAVAAVPAQGISFWNRCGYEVAVPLGYQGPGEAVSALGEFLLDNMLLFTDTPLVAKVLA